MTGVGKLLLALAAPRSAIPAVAEHLVVDIFLLIEVSRDVVSVSLSQSRDGLETYFRNVSASSRSQEIVGRSRSPRFRLALKVKRLGHICKPIHQILYTDRLCEVPAYR